MYESTQHVRIDEQIIARVGVAIPDRLRHSALSCVLLVYTAFSATASKSVGRDQTAEQPPGPIEKPNDSAVFYTAPNRVSGDLELWGFAKISECATDQSHVAKYAQADYGPPSECVVIRTDDLAPPPLPPSPPAPAEVLPIPSPATPCTGRATPSTGDPDADIVARLLAHKDKHLRVEVDPKFWTRG